jgi:hypothetical protein
MSAANIYFMPDGYFYAAIDAAQARTHYIDVSGTDEELAAWELLHPLVPLSDTELDRFRLGVVDCTPGPLPPMPDTLRQRLQKLAASRAPLPHRITDLHVVYGDPPPA